MNKHGDKKERYSLQCTLPNLDNGNYVIEKDVPVFHDGGEGHYSPKDLAEIAANTNARQQTCDLPAVVIGHVREELPEHMQPPVVGFARNFRVVNFSGRPTIIADLAIHKDHVAEAKQFPRRSAEIWQDGKYIDPIALLGASTPARDLSLMFSKNEQCGCKEKTSLELNNSMDNTQLVDELLKALESSDVFAWAKNQMEQQEAKPMQPQVADPMSEGMVQPVDEYAAEDRRPRLPPSRKALRQAYEPNLAGEHAGDRDIDDESYNMTAPPGLTGGKDDPSTGHKSHLRPENNQSLFSDYYGPSKNAKMGGQGHSNSPSPAERSLANTTASGAYGEDESVMVSHEDEPWGQSQALVNNPDHFPSRRIQTTPSKNAKDDHSIKPYRSEYGQSFGVYDSNGNLRSGPHSSEAEAAKAHLRMTDFGRRQLAPKARAEQNAKGEPEMIMPPKNTGAFKSRIKPRKPVKLAPPKDTGAFEPLDDGVDFGPNSTRIDEGAYDRANVERAVGSPRPTRAKTNPGRIDEGAYRRAGVKTMAKDDEQYRELLDEELSRMRQGHKRPVKKMDKNDQTQQPKAETPNTDLNNYDRQVEKIRHESRNNPGSNSVYDPVSGRKYRYSEEDELADENVNAEMEDETLTTEDEGLAGEAEALADEQEGLSEEEMVLAEEQLANADAEEDLEEDEEALADEDLEEDDDETLEEDDMDKEAFAATKRKLVKYAKAYHDIKESYGKRIADMERKARVAERKNELMQLEAEGYEFDFSQELKDVADLPVEQYSKHKERIRKCYRKAPIGQPSFTPAYNPPAVKATFTYDDSRKAAEMVKSGKAKDVNEAFNLIRGGVNA